MILTNKTRNRLLYQIATISAACCITIGASNPAWLAVVFRSIFFMIAAVAYHEMITNS